jgi:hypothetical protein
MPSLAPYSPRDLTVEIDEGGAGYVTRLVGSAARASVQIPAEIDDPQTRFSEVFLEPAPVHQRPYRGHRIRR